MGSVKKVLSKTTMSNSINKNLLIRYQYGTRTNLKEYSAPSNYSDWFPRSSLPLPNNPPNSPGAYPGVSEGGGGGRDILQTS